MTTFQFQPKWMEEIVVTASDGSFILDLNVGVLRAYLPTDENWPEIAPPRAKDLYPVLGKSQKPGADEPCRFRVRRDSWRL